MSKSTHYKGPAIRVTQKNRTFCYMPMPSKQAAAFLANQTLKWDEKKSAFAGFNREVNESHVISIINGLKQEDTIIPNAVIAYLLSEGFEFKPDGNARAPIETGQAKIFVTDEKQDVGFVIDGQHRIEALRRIELESGEEDLTIGLVIFHAPADDPLREEFDKFVLSQMAIINAARPLSPDEKKTVQQRLDRVEKALGETSEYTANLILKLLDEENNSHIRFSALSKKAPTGKTWLKLKVWSKIIKDLIDSSNVINAIFKGNYSESLENRKKAARIIKLYIKAIVGLMKDKDLWEVSPQKQRLYHNVGLSALLLSLDNINQAADVFSTVEGGKIKVNDVEAVRKIQKILKPIRLLDWSVGVADSKDPNDKSALKMAAVQQQGKIPGNFMKALQGLINSAVEVQKGKSEILYEFQVRGKAEEIICKEKIKLSSEDLNKLDQSIDEGIYDA